MQNSRRRLRLGYIYRSAAHSAGFLCAQQGANHSSSSARDKQKR